MISQYTVTNKMINLITEISKLVGNLEFDSKRSLRLRKENQIRSIHSSLAIENNTLSLEQMTSIIDGQRVVGTKLEILEVQNAFEVYEKLNTLDPFNENHFLDAHQLLVKDIVEQSGQYRLGDVGIFDASGNVVHMGARPQFIPELMDDLFHWLKNDELHPIIKSCIFHYEVEAIHPFQDGNGRMGRLWQSTILSSWHPIFRWLPVETMIRTYQQTYYNVLASADMHNDCSIFIEFMLDLILDTLKEHERKLKELDKEFILLNEKEYDIFKMINEYIKQETFITTQEASNLIGKSAPTMRRYLVKFVELELLIAKGENRNRRYELNQR